MGEILNQNKEEPEKVVIDENFSTANVGSRKRERK